MSDMSEHTDEAIARLVQQGEHEAFGQLIERYAPKMTRYGRKFLFNHDDIEDLVQEVFIKAYVNIQSFDASRSFSPWLYRIAHNEFINALKKKSRQKIFSFDLDTLFPHPISAQTADGDLQRADIKKFLDQYLEKIDPKYREPLILYYLEEMNYQEIADILQIPMSTVGVRLQRGKIRLKKLIPTDNLPYGK